MSPRVSNKDGAVENRALVSFDFPEKASEEKLYVLKKSGRMVAIKGLRYGTEPVMIISPASMIDKLKYGMATSEVKNGRMSKMTLDEV